MITEDDKLLVFEDVVEDRSLPKFQVPDTDDADEGEQGIGVSMVRHPASVTMRRFRSNPSRFNIRTGANVVGTVSLDGDASSDDSVRLVPLADVPVASKKPSTWSRFAFWRKAPSSPSPSIEEPEGISIVDFFAHLKNSQQELVVVKARAKGYERAIKNAMAASQHALVEQLKDGLNAHAMEAQLVALGLTKFLTEETVVRFYKQAKKGLRLDRIHNFSRTIPEEVVAKKARADELGLFDAYVVLHYDPQARSFAETEAEKHARKDPILFGLMKGRRVLYVVGDWVDEVCDLTLDQIAEQLGADVVGSLVGPAHPYR